MHQTAASPSADPLRALAGPPGAASGAIPGAGEPVLGPPPPPGWPVSSARAAGRRAVRRYRFRDGLRHSSLLHLLTFFTLVAAGVGPRAKETLIRREARLVFEPPRQPVEAEVLEVEPDRPIEADEPPEPELTPVEEPPLTELADEPFPELAEMADPMDLLRDMPLDPLERIEPEPPEPPEPLVAEVDPPIPEPLAVEPEPDPIPPAVAVVVEGPRILDSRAPGYPRASYRMGHEGSVLLRIEVGPGGRVLAITVLESSGHERLDQAAIAAVRAWRFGAGTEDGVPVRATLDHRLTFRIQG